MGHSESGRRTFVWGLNESVPNPEKLVTSDIFNLVGGNTGNLAFHYAISNDIAVAGRSALNWGVSAKELNEAGSLAVIPAANHLNALFDAGPLALKLHDFRGKAVMIGLGAQSGLSGGTPEVPNGTLDWIREVAERQPGSGPNISLRGDFSASTMEKVGLGGKATVLGCPSLFINRSPDLGLKIQSNRRPIKKLAVLAGSTSWSTHRTWERLAARLVTLSEGSYIGQSGLHMMQLTRGEVEKMSLEDVVASRDYISPDLEVLDFAKWTKVHGEIFFNIPNWMNFYRDFDFVIGPRIHGVVLAMQAGVPGVVVVHDSRTLELCEKMMIPFILLDDVSESMSLHDFYDLFEFDSQAFDHNRQILSRKYTEFLETNELTADPGLQKIRGAQT